MILYRLKAIQPTVIVSSLTSDLKCGRKHHGTRSAEAAKSHSEAQLARETTSLHFVQTFFLELQLASTSTCSHKCNSKSKIKAGLSSLRRKDIQLYRSLSLDFSVILYVESFI